MIYLYYYRNCLINIYCRALALNCNADINNKDGATAVDWKKGKPVRVVRNYKLRKHSEYAPAEGNRYGYFIYESSLLFFFFLI